MKEMMTTLPTQYVTEQPQLTLTLLAASNIEAVSKNLQNGRFLLYLLGREEPLTPGQLERYASVITFDIPDFDSLHPSAPDGLTEGVLLVTNNGGEVTAVNVAWVTGLEDPAAAYTAFVNLPLSQQKSFIHSRLLQSILVPND